MKRPKLPDLQSYLARLRTPFTRPKPPETWDEVKARHKPVQFVWGEPDEK